MIHTLKFKDTNLAFDANTLYLFEINEEQVDAWLRNGVSFENEKAQKGSHEVALIRRLSEKAGSIDNTYQNSNITSIWLHLAHACNLRCKYCFADAGTYCSHKGLMKKSTAMKAVDFLLDTNENGSVNIVFFGGEPLLNFKVLRSTVEYAIENAVKLSTKISFQVITNLTLITEEIADFCRDNKVQVQISLDGPREMNDQLRVLPDGSGSFDKIMENIDILRQRGVPLRGVRATLTDVNSDVLEVYDFLRGLGFPGVGMVAVQPDDRTSVRLSTDGAERVKCGYRKIAQRIIDRIESYGLDRPIDLGPFSRHIKRIKNRTLRWAFCDRGISMISVTPDGFIYPCHRVVSEPEMQIGDVFHGLTKPLSQFDQMGRVGIQDKPSCQNCWIKRMCGGGCAASSTCANGVPTQPDEMQCEILREEVEGALKIYYALSLATRTKINRENQES